MRRRCVAQVLVSASDGVVDVHSKTTRSVSAEALFQTPQASAAGASRASLARFLRVDARAGRFGSLRPALVGGGGGGGGREVRWVCAAHYDELAALPSSK